jgi:peroxiredoxin
LGCSKADPEVRLVGERAPAVALETIDHGRFYLQAERGKPVVLMFWDTSCQICKQQLVELEALRQALGPQRLAMAGVCQDPENIDLARSVVAGLGLGFPTLLDHEGRVTAAYGIDTFPTTIVVSPTGEIGFRRVGYTAPLMHQLRGVLEGYFEAAGRGR